MPLDPNISLQVKPLVIKDPMNAMLRAAQISQIQQQSQINAMNMASARRDEESQNRLAARLQQGGRLTLDEAGSYGKQGVDYATSVAKFDVEQEALAIAKLSKWQDALTRINLNDPAQVDQWKKGISAELPGIAGGIATMPLATEEDRTDFLKDADMLRQVSIEKAKQEAVAKNRSNVRTVGNFIYHDDTGQFQAPPSSAEPVKPPDPFKVAKDRREEERLQIEKDTEARQKLKTDTEIALKRDANVQNGRKALGILKSSISTIDELLGSDEKNPKYHPGLEAATGLSAKPWIPSILEDTRNAEAIMKKVESGASVQGLQEIRANSGAIGTITEREWPIIQGYIAALERTQGTPAYAKHLADYRMYLKELEDKISKEVTKGQSSSDAKSSTDDGTPKPGSTVRRKSDGMQFRVGADGSLSPL